MVALAVHMSCATGGLRICVKIQKKYWEVIRKKKLLALWQRINYVYKDETKKTSREESINLQMARHTPDFPPVWHISLYFRVLNRVEMNVASPSKIKFAMCTKNCQKKNQNPLPYVFTSTGTQHLLV